MSHARLATLVAAVACALLLGGAGTASAATTQTFAKKVGVTGTAKNGKKFTGTYRIDHFAKRNGKLVAVGTLSGTLKHRHVTRHDVRMPVSGPSSDASTAQVLPPTPGACQILNLVLGPIDLNLLGLRVRTNTIRLRIEAVPGPGNLLGNLLCGITGLLDANTLANTQLGQLTQILNALLALAPRTG